MKINLNLAKKLSKIETTRLYGYVYEESRYNLRNVCLQFNIISDVNSRLEYNYKDILSFITKNKRKPSYVSKDIKERRLIKLIESYTRNKHLKFILQLEELYDKFNLRANKDSIEQGIKENYKSYLFFVKKNKRKPSYWSTNKEEKRLYHVYSSYKNGKSKHRHIEFIKQVDNLLKKLKIQANKYTGACVEDSKNECLFFVIKNNKKLNADSKDAEEKRLADFYARCKSGKNKSKHTEFVKEMQKLYDNIEPKNSYKSILNFIKQNKTEPNIKSIERIEKNLAQCLKYYRTNPQKHIGFIKQVEDLLKEIKGE